MSPARQVRQEADMNLEPQKFFIGLVDFFSILMPGAMLAYLGKDWVAAKLGLPCGFPLNGVEAGVVFFFASYLLGHFAFLFSSALDELVYDPVRAWTDWGQISRHLAGGGDLSGRRRRRFAASDWLFGKGADNAVMQVQRMKARALQGLGAENAVNAFQWSKARLLKELPEGLLAVERFEADSKFFRSFVIVLAALAVFYFFRGRWLAAGLCATAIVPALWRYIDQRFKATQHAYWYIIGLEAMKPPPAAPVPGRDGLTHAGGIVFRRKDAVPHFLLIEASADRSQRVLPKGHIEPGEDPRVTAVREVKEETGHWARVVQWLEDKPLGNHPNAPVVRWFLLELAEEGKDWPKENRQGQWLPLDEAAKTATFRETVALLEAAARHLGSAKSKTGQVQGKPRAQSSL
jgi:8-oxo-dGTP pyrophosphatase MutT (NUDIX family)